MPVTILRELPKCDVCLLRNVPEPKDATGDSVIRDEACPGGRSQWGYTCDDHASLRLGIVTHLFLEEAYRSKSG